MVLEHCTHLRYSEAVTNPEEFRSINTSKRALEEKREVAVGRVKELKELLEGAQKELEVLDEQIRGHARLVSPLRRIPPHILCDIFTLAIPFAPVRFEDLVLTAPSTLLLVCKYWRD
ncbi:hypothetical protein BDV98DRAFT_607305, partial [Pterulicium gracile]